MQESEMKGSYVSGHHIGKNLFSNILWQMVKKLWCEKLYPGSKFWEEVFKEVFPHIFPQEPTVTLMGVTPEGVQGSDNICFRSY